MNKKPSTQQNKKRAPKPGEPVAASASEADFLAQQAVDAKAAISRKFSQISTDLGVALSPGTLMRGHPWMTLAGSAVAGFVATAVMVPSKEDLALRKLAKIERALNPEPPPRKADADDEDDRTSGVKSYKSGRTSFLRTMMGEVIKAVQPAVLSMLTAGVTATAARPSQEEIKAAAAQEDQENRNPVPA